MTVVELDQAGSSSIDLAGGKAAGLGRLIRAGERVPTGFCLTTRAFDSVRPALERTGTGGAGGTDGGGGTDGEGADSSEGIGLPDGLCAEIAAAYQRLGGGSVAVRSSATAEDLPFASFAGQQDTFLNVTGVAEVITAVSKCWASLWSERAVRYREINEIGDDRVAMAVVVQRMIDPAVAGVLFTANPVAGSRTQMAVDAAVGLGTTVVDGSGPADHYVLDHVGPIEHALPVGPADRARGCLDHGQLDLLRAAGLRVQEHFGAPQDIEWAIDHDGTLWLLQSRPITTLFPAPPATDRPLPRIYLSNGPVQGMLRPYAPMGMCVMKNSAAAMLAADGIRADPINGPAGFVDVAGRTYADVTDFLRNRAVRRYLGEGWLGGTQGMAVLEGFLADLPRPRRSARLRTAARVALWLGPAAVAGTAGTLLRPAAARAKASRTARRIERLTTAPANMTTEERLHFIETAQYTVMRRAMGGLLWPVMAGILAAQIPVELLKGIAASSEVETTLRGMPHSVTTEMDLALWRLARRAGAYRDLLMSTPPADLAAEYLAGRLPEFGLDGFLAAYGRRAVAELDIGMPRWAENPAVVFTAIANYLRVTDARQAPDERFARAAAEAEAKIDELVRRSRRVRPVRGRIAGFLLRRARDVGGLRELPKFVWMHAITQMRQQLLLIGAELTERALLRRAEDVMFLNLAEVREALAGRDCRQLVTLREEVYRRETRRRRVPRVLLSDGTDPETLASTPVPGENVLSGTAASPGTVTGVARVILDPIGAHLEPGEILVAPTTDPGWTPLFLTAGALVTDTGTPIAHGPTVAREHGIPAVVGVPDATWLIRSGETITVDGSAGTVRLETGAGEIATEGHDGPPAPPDAGTGRRPGARPMRFSSPP